MRVSDHLVRSESKQSSFSSSSHQQQTTAEHISSRNRDLHSQNIYGVCSFFSPLNVFRYNICHSEQGVERRKLLNPPSSNNIHDSQVTHHDAQHSITRLLSWFVKELWSASVLLGCLSSILPLQRMRWKQRWCGFRDWVFRKHHYDLGYRNNRRRFLRYVQECLSVHIILSTVIGEICGTLKWISHLKHRFLIVIQVVDFFLTAKIFHLSL